MPPARRWWRTTRTAQNGKGQRQEAGAQAPFHETSADDRDDASHRFEAGAKRQNGLESHGGPTLAAG